MKVTVSCLRDLLTSFARLHLVPGLLALPILSGTFTPTVLAQTVSPPQNAKEWWQRCQQEWNAGQYDVAKQSCQKALMLYQEKGDLKATALVLSGLGVLHGSLHDYNKATEYQIQGLAVARNSGDQQLVVKALLNLGQAYAAQSQYTREIAAYEEGLVLARKIHFPQGELTALNFLAYTYSIQRNLPQAIAYHEQSLQLANQLQDIRSQVRSLINLGSAYTELGKVDQAIAVLEPGIVLARSQGWQMELAWVTGKLGGAYRVRGDYSQAIALYQQSLETARSLKDPGLETVALNELGRVHEAKGDYAKAIEAHQQAYELATSHKHPKNQITALNGLGLAYYNLGDFSQAVSLQTQQLALAKQAKDLEGQSWALSLLGLTHSAKREFETGLGYLNQASELMRQVGDRWGEAAVLANLGGAYRNLARYPEAVKSYEQSLALMRSLNHLAGESRIWANLGSVYRNQKQYAQARAAYQKGLTLARQVGDDTTSSYILANLGLLFYWSNDLAQAEQFLREAIAVRESLRTRLGQKDAFKVALADMEITTLTYLNLQRVLIARNQPETALEIAEQGRARAFAELIAGNREVDSAASLSPPSLAQIRQVAQQQNTTLVEYSILDNGLAAEDGGGDRRPEIAIWVVQPSGKISFRQVSLNAKIQAKKNLTDLVLNGRTALRSRSIGVVAQREQTAPSHQEPLKELYQLLIQPIADLLPRDAQATVVFVPQGSLFLVPFAALQNPQGQYLIQQHTLAISPSIQVLDLTHRKQQSHRHPQQQQQNVLVVGNPTMPTVPLGEGEPPARLDDLPGAEVEAQAIAELFRTQAITGDSATKSTVVERMQQAHMIHLATHGLLEDFQNTGIPGAIALAPTISDSGLLTAAELLKLTLKAEMVVLSACDTGRGKITGDGVVGLSRSLISAGASSVIVSLWAVPDTPTAALMTEFYHHLLRYSKQKHSSKADALRQAMLKTMEKYPSPSDWAAFVLIGDFQ